MLEVMAGCSIRHPLGRRVIGILRHGPEVSETNGNFFRAVERPAPVFGQRELSLIAFPIGLVLGNVLMALVYYLLVTPIGPYDMRILKVISTTSHQTVTVCAKRLFARRWTSLGSARISIPTADTRC